MLGKDDLLNSYLSKGIVNRRFELLVHDLTAVLFKEKVVLLFMDDLFLLGIFGLPIFMVKIAG